jgi:pyruvate,water dikinase
VRHLLSLVQRFMRLRERLRSYVTEVLGMFRELALDASHRLERRDPALGADAAFFLTVDELRGVLSGELRHIVALVRQRRRQYERDVALPDPPDTFVGYPPQVEAPAAPTGSDGLTGLGASSGRYEGLARVLLTPADASELRRGEVLVAPYADVGWSPLFTVAGAVVTDLGGPLSHASIVAREYGVPSVVNVKVGTRVIRTGDRVEVDGDAGTVRIVEPAS